MAGTKEIKRRIRSVKNTKKITKAMELVAASKMKRAVVSTMASRLYAEYSWKILTSIAENVKDKKEDQTHPFFIEQKEGEILIVLITSNRGLCGAYNAQVIKKTIHKLKEFKGENKIKIIAVGKKGNIAMERIGQNVISSFTEMPDTLTFRDVAPLSKQIIDEFQSVFRQGQDSRRTFKKIYIAYTDFVSALTQKPNIKQILPIAKTELKDFIETIGKNIEKETTLGAKLPNGSLAPKTEYLFEGNQDVLIASLAEKITSMQIYQMLLESNASEQSSRMVAMKNASEASGEMIDDLTLVFNKARQSNITREISEISAGMASVS